MANEPVGPATGVQAGATAPKRVSEVDRFDLEGLAQHLKPLANEARLRLLHMLTTPHYLEEIATELGMSRQGARKHVESLAELGVIQSRKGRRAHGPVTEYVLDRARIFQLQTEFARLGRLRPEEHERDIALTIAQSTHGVPEPERASRTACLAVVRGLEEGRSFRLSEQPGRAWRIGRHADAEVQLDYDPFVSNRHAEIRRGQSGFQLVDLFSRNGTRLNWRQIEQGREQELVPGDIIAIGKTLLVLQNRQG